MIGLPLPKQLMPELFKIVREIDPIKDIECIST